jgi:hypothetical protein
MIPYRNDPCNGVGLYYTGFDALIMRNPRDSDAKYSANATK